MEPHLSMQRGNLAGHHVEVLADIME